MTTEATQEPEILWEYKPSDKPFIVTHAEEDGYCATISRFRSLEDAISEAQHIASVFTNDHITVTKEEHGA